MQQQSELKQKTIRGFLWSFADVLGNQGTQFLIQIVLARLLLPEHFGLIGMILIFIAVSNSLIDSGFTQALIREQHATQADYSTVFYFNLLMSLVVYLALFLLAPAVSGFFQTPELVDILRVLGLGIIINAFAIIPRAMFTKDVNFEVQTKVNLTASVVSGAVAIFLAVSGFGVWSLVFRTLTMSAVQAVLLQVVRQWLPSLVFSLQSFRRLFGFGWKLLVSGLIDTIYDNIYFVIIGRQYTAAQLGYYTNASKLNDVASHTLTATIHRVTYPVLSSIQDNEQRLKEAYRKVIKFAAFIIFPVMMGLAAVGEPLVELVFGEQWLPMVLYFQLLCFAGMLYPIHAINLNILQVKGRSDLFLYLEIIKKVLLSVLIVIAVVLGTGITGLIFAAILSSYIALVINIHFCAKEIHAKKSEQYRDLLPAYLLAVSVGGAMLAAGAVLPDIPLLKLAVQLFAGAALYLGGSYLLKISELHVAWELLVPMLKKVKLKKAG